MNDAAGVDGNSGGGGSSSNVGSLSFEDILAIVKSDKENVGRAREQAEGIRLLHSVLADMHSVIGDNTKTLKANYSTPADGALYRGIETMLPSLDSASSAAKYTAEELETAADETDSAYERVMEHSGEMDKLDETSAKDLKQFADPGTGEDGRTVLYKDITEDTRTAFKPADEAYSSGEIGLVSFTTDDYEGPEWTGGDPKTSLDNTYYGHRPEGGDYGGDGSGLNRGGTNAAATSGGHSTPNHDSTQPPTRDEPELQTPGTNPTPTPNPGPTTQPGPGPVNNGHFPVGPPPATGGGVKPVTPPSGGGRPIGTNGLPNNARPTPGMNRPVSTGGMRNTGAPPSGRGGAGNRSLLPNQRQAMNGRTPVSGSGRMPGGSQNPSRAGAPGGSRSTVSGTGRNAPGSVRGGVTRGRPNAGFEEQMYRNTRAGRTVPGVIGSKQPGEGKSSGRAGAPRVGSAGKVFGERSNKGRPKASQPKLSSGSITGAKRKSKKDTKHTWQRSKPEASTALPSGSVAVDRITGSRPSSPEELRQAALAKRRAARRELWKRQERGEAEHIPASELFGGTEGRAGRSVITGARPSAPVDRRDAGTVFGTHGYED